MGNSQSSGGGGKSGGMNYSITSCDGSTTKGKIGMIPKNPGMMRATINKTTIKTAMTRPRRTAITIQHLTE